MDDHVDGTQTLERIALAQGACAPGWYARRSGTYRFVVVNGASWTASVELQQALSGVVVARIAAATPSSSRPLDVELAAGGEYRWSCTTAGSTRYSAAVQVPAAGDSAAETVKTPAPPAAVDLIRPLGEYAAHTEQILPTLRRQLATLETQIHAGSLTGAQQAWLAAHLSWIELGQDDEAYGAFGALGGEIDATAAGKIAGTASPSFTGFHRIEFDLWVRHDLTAAASDTDTLMGLVNKLTAPLVDADLKPTTAGMDSWVLRAHEILEDALRDSLSGEDDYGSNTDLASVQADVSATREMLTLLSPLLDPRVPGLVLNARRELTTIDRAITAVHPGTALPWPSLSALPTRARERIDASVDAALETLAPISELMQVGNS